MLEFFEMHWKWPIKNHFVFLLLRKFMYSLTMAYWYLLMPLVTSIHYL